jgi:hypothetical protein
MKDDAYLEPTKQNPDILKRFQIPRAKLFSVRSSNI